MSTELEAKAHAPAEMPMDLTDVEECFKLLLGRMPDAEDVRQCIHGETAAVLRALIHGEGFRTLVLTPLMLRERLPQEKIAQTPPLRLIDWVQRRLPLTPLTRSRAGAAGSWAQLLELVLSDQSMANIASDLAAAEIDRVLRERLEVQPLWKIRRSVVGSIDSATAVEIRGWAMDLCDRSVPVTLEFFADNLFVGAITCGDFRPDVQEAVGGDGQCGFNFKIPTGRRRCFEGGRLLIAMDSVSHAQVGAATEVHADLTIGLDILGQTRRELKILREMLQRIESRLPDLGRLASVPLDAYGDYFDRFYRAAPDTLASQRTEALSFGYAPLISLVLPAWNSNLRLLDDAIASVRAQTYGRWELVIADGAPVVSDELRMMMSRHADDARVRWVPGNGEAGIAANTNRGLAAALGDYLGFIDHDDLLPAEALFEVVRALQERRYALVYTDEDRIEDDAVGGLKHHTPFFKPGFDPELLLSMNYLCHLVVLRRDVLPAEGLRQGFEGAQDHDLMLRATEALTAEEVKHVPRILYHWRVTPGSVSRTPALTQSIQHNIVTAVQGHLDRRGGAARVEPHSDPVGVARMFATRVRWQLPATAPKVSIIVPTRDRLDLLRPCIDSILRSAPKYPGALEIIVVDNDSVDAATHEYLNTLAGTARSPGDTAQGGPAQRDTAQGVPAQRDTAQGVPAQRGTAQVRVERFVGPFNWSAINNAAARSAEGEVLIFLNNDTVVLTDDWCAELAANALRPGVGAVGARLLYADGTLQHAGVVLGVEGVAGHDSVGEGPELGGYFGRSHLQRSTAAVTGACLATRRDLFEQAGGFDDIDFKVAFNDVDYCLRLRAQGHAVIYNPFAVLYHFESKSRGHELSADKQARYRAEVAIFRTRWRHIVDDDPFYNAHFERYARPFSRLRAPPAC